MENKSRCKKKSYLDFVVNLYNFNIYFIQSEKIVTIHRDLITFENICFPFIITRLQKLLAAEIDEEGIGHIGIDSASIEFQKASCVSGEGTLSKTTRPLSPSPDYYSLSVSRYKN